MATLSVTKFPTPEGADQALATLKSLQQQQLIQVLDAATVSWPAGRKSPKTKQMSMTTGAGLSEALSGACSSASSSSYLSWARRSGLEWVR